MDQISHFRSGSNSARSAQDLHADVLDADFDGYDEGLEDDAWPSRMSSSVRRYRSDVALESGRTTADVQFQPGWTGGNPVPPRRTARRTAYQAPGRRIPVDTEDFVLRPVPASPTRTRRRITQRHWSVYFGLGLAATVLGWAALSMVVGWWQTTLDNWQYGNPRTYQTDQVVGHNDSIAHPSHFIALNFNGHIEVIEFPGGDGSKAKIYIGPVLTGPDQNLSPVTLAFKDLTTDGKIDMIVNVQGTHFVFINDNGQFRVPRPGEVLSSF